MGSISIRWKFEKPDWANISARGMMAAAREAKVGVVLSEDFQHGREIEGWKGSGPLLRALAPYLSEINLDGVIWHSANALILPERRLNDPAGLVEHQHLQDPVPGSSSQAWVMCSRA